jgi:hypothetical protein
MITNDDNLSKRPSDSDIARELNEMIALHPQHPGGYEMLGKYYLQSGDHRAALAALRKSKEFKSPDYPMQAATYEIPMLEAEASWEAKLPGVLRGEIKPANIAEIQSLASYCATFEKKFALATRVVIDASKADPHVLDGWFFVAKFAGWAAQASAGHGADGASLTDAERAAFRRQAFVWLRDMRDQQAKKGALANLRVYFHTIRDLSPVRDTKELAKLPPAERAEWEELWESLKIRPVTPPPRPVK